MSFLWRNPSFCLLWLGQILSQSGGRMYQIAMIWWLVGRHSENAGRWVGCFMVVAALPSPLLMKTVGNWIDRVSSRRILVTCDLLASAVVLSVALYLWGGSPSAAWVFIAGFLAAAFQATIDPTLNKSVGDVVSKEDYESAVALLASTQSLANFSGAVVGALLIDRMGVAGTAGLAAIGYLISATCSSRVQFRPSATADTNTEGISIGSFFLEYPWVKKVLYGFAAINFFATPTLVILPLYVKTVLGGSANLLGKMEACLWSGLLAGTFLSRWVPNTGNRIFVGALCLYGFGLALTIPSQWVSPSIYGLSLFLACTAVGVNNVKFLSLFQEVVPADRKGRFFALLQGMIGFTFPIAFFLFGLLADQFSPQGVCLIQGMGVLTVATYFVFLSSREKVSHGSVCGY